MPGRITGIRVQDIQRQIWYNWDDPERRWYTLSGSTKTYVDIIICNPGANSLYVGFWVVASGSAVLYHFTLANGANLLVDNWFTLSNGQTHGEEWTGTMPALKEFNLVCAVAP